MRVNMVLTIIAMVLALASLALAIGRVTGWF